MKKTLLTSVNCLRKDLPAWTRPDFGEKTSVGMSSPRNFAASLAAGNFYGGSEELLGELLVNVPGVPDPSGGYEGLRYE